MKLVEYLRDTRGELRHVNWPTSKQVWQFTALVLTISLLMAMYMGFFDALFSYILKTFVI